MPVVKILRSATSGNVPSSLAAGQIAINEADGLLFFRDSTGAVAAMPLVGSNNLVINGGMEVSQEYGSTLRSAPNSYAIDMFGMNSGGVSVLNSQQVVDAPAGMGLRTSLKATVATADASVTGTDTAQIWFQIEGLRCQRLLWGTASAVPISLGFWVKANRAGTYSGSVRNGPNNRSYTFNFTISAGGTWEYKKVTIPGDTSGTWTVSNTLFMVIVLAMAMGSTYTTAAGSWTAGNFLGATGTINGVAATSDYMQITGVSVVPGSQAVPGNLVSKVIRPFAEELLLCERYWQKSSDYPELPGTVSGNGNWNVADNNTPNATNSGSWPVIFATRMRTVPTVTLFSAGTGAAGKVRDGAFGVDVNGNAGNKGETGFTISATANGATTVYNYSAHWAADCRM